MDWANTIVSRLPSFALSDPYVATHVTIEDMLSHRSGLPGAAGDLLEDLGYDQAYVIDRLRLDPLTPMRTQYNYANFGFTAGAIAAANAVSQTWADFAAATLFGPLGMTQSSYRHSDFVNRTSHTRHARPGGRCLEAALRAQRRPGGTGRRGDRLGPGPRHVAAAWSWPTACGTGRQFIEATALGSDPPARDPAEPADGPVCADQLLRARVGHQRRRRRAGCAGATPARSSRGPRPRS